MKWISDLFFDSGFSVVSPLLEKHGLGVDALVKVDRRVWNEQIERAWQLAKSLGKNVVLVSNSYGNVFATELDKRHPGQVKSHIGIAPFLKHHSKLAAFSVGITRARKVLRTERFRDYDEDLTWEAIAETYVHAKDMRRDLRRDEPTETRTVYHLAREDTVISNSHAIRYLKTLDNAEAHLLDGTGHYTFLDVNGPVYHELTNLIAAEIRAVKRSSEE